MREVASSINEKKRKVANIKKIAEWQLKIDQWQVLFFLIEHIINKNTANLITFYIFRGRRRPSKEQPTCSFWRSQQNFQGKNTKCDVVSF